MNNSRNLKRSRSDENTYEINKQSKKNCINREIGISCIHIDGCGCKQCNNEGTQLIKSFNPGRVKEEELEKIVLEELKEVIIEIIDDFKVPKILIGTCKSQIRVETLASEIVVMVRELLYKPLRKITIEQFPYNTLRYLRIYDETVDDEDEDDDNYKSRRSLISISECDCGKPGKEFVMALDGLRDKIIDGILVKTNKSDLMHKNLSDNRKIILCKRIYSFIVSFSIEQFATFLVEDEKYINRMFEKCINNKDK